MYSDIFSEDPRQKKDILILAIDPIRHKERDYLRIIGLDIFSGRVVTIVDTNGGAYGLHSYQDSWSRIPESAIIQGLFVQHTSSQYPHTLRVVSDISILDAPRIRNPRAIYDFSTAPGERPARYNEQPIPCNTYDFSYVASFCKNHPSSFCYFLVEIKPSQVRKYNNKYQIRQNGYFVDIDPTQIPSIYENLFYQGLTLVECRVRSDGRYRMTAYRMYDDYYLPGVPKDSAVLKQLLGLDEDEELDYIPDDEWEEEFFREDMDSLGEIYEDYDPEIYSEYNEYSDEYDSILDTFYLGPADIDPDQPF